jgi:hypothetical protein
MLLHEHGLLLHDLEWVRGNGIEPVRARTGEASKYASAIKSGGAPLSGMGQSGVAPTDTWI